MNNGYNNQREVYTIRGDMCYDNKAMVNAGLPDRPLPHTVVLNVADRDCEASTTKTSPLRKLQSRLRAPHLVDLLIFVVVSSLMLLLELGYVPNAKLGFLCKDPTISYPFRGDTISSTTLLVASFFGPILVISLIEVLREKSFKQVRLGTVWGYYKECLIGVALVLLVTEITKVLVGEQRPHFFDSCEPDANRYCQPGALILEYNCTNQRISDYFKTDITRSFPSGHSSISMFVALYCAYLVHARVPCMNVSTLTKPLLIAVCLTWTLVCSLTRITDRRHHWWDVLAGNSLGALGALYTIFLLRRSEKTQRANLLRANASTTTLLDVKNKDATSVII